MAERVNSRASISPHTRNSLHTVHPCFPRQRRHCHWSDAALPRQCHQSRRSSPCSRAFLNHSSDLEKKPGKVSSIEGVTVKLVTTHPAIANAQPRPIERSKSIGKKQRPKKHKDKVDPDASTVWPAEDTIVTTASKGVAPPSISSR
eukprot:scaffold3761_cov372-Prasinococcus_capsulatus_cf.AAC.32